MPGLGSAGTLAQPEPRGKCGLSWRFCGGHTPISQLHSSGFPSLPSRHPGPPCLPVPGHWAASPSSLASPHSDSKTPLCLPRRGGLSQILPTALLGIPLQSEASSSYPANNGHRDCVNFLEPAWVHPACFILLPKKKRAGGRETSYRLSKFLWALAWLLACCQSSGLGASSTPRIWDSIPAPHTLNNLSSLQTKSPFDLYHSLGTYMPVVLGHKK